MRILVAGATGFIGSHLTPALLDAGHDVYALVRNPAAAGLARERMHFVEADLAKPFQVTLPAVETVIHLAQANVSFPSHAEELLAVNCGSAAALAAHAQRCGAGRVIYASSGTVYGFSSGLLAEDHLLDGAGYYAQTKIAAERLLSEFRAHLPVDLLRIFTPYGTGQADPRLIPDIISRVREGRPVTVRANGMPALTPIHVSDVVRVIMARLRAMDGLTMNVAGAESTGIRGIAECAGRLLEREPVFELNPSPLDGGMAADSSLMTACTGVHPLSLKDGLSRLLAGDSTPSR
ncbi:MAG TPA: NAD(P)-dependent oxidoreductase [Verrucomicrobiales bacterium]|nr:NAD(P)-dependent oxidoreductase [Verrucomicrobiales bacterium]